MKNKFKILMVSLVITVWMTKGNASGQFSPSEPSRSDATSEEIVVAGKARITVISPEVIRLEYHPRGVFFDEASLFAVNRKNKRPNFSVTRNDEEVNISTSRMAVRYRDNGRPLSAENFSVTIFRSDRGNILWNPEIDNSGNLGGTRASLDYAKFPVVVEDGVLSKEGWFWLDDSLRDLTDSEGWIFSRTKYVTPEDRASGYTDGYFFAYDRDYKAALKALITVGGEIPIPRRTVFGSWYSRWWAYSSKDFRKIIEEFKAHDFPLDNLVMDLDWHNKGWGGYSWNRKLLPDAEIFLAELKKQNINVVLNDHPDSSMVPQEDSYSNFMAELGKNPASGEVVPFDGGDKQYVNAFFKHAHGPRDKDGAGVWWLDWMGDNKKPFNTMPWISRLFFEYSSRPFANGSQNSEGLVTGSDGQKLDGNSLRGQGFARWGGWGSHRYPIHFSGDTLINWSTLENLVPFTATAGNMGAAYWSHEIGGFIDENPTLTIPLGLKQRELTARWTQLAAFSPVMRLHSVNFWHLDKRPWLWGARVEKSMQIFFQLRAQLIPYIYSHARFTEQTGIPLVRPMYLDWPKEETAYENPQQYMFGEAFLVAPITKKANFLKSEGAQKVWFPQGEKWFDWFSGKEVSTGIIDNYLCDLNRMPLFARGGVPILMQPYSQRPTSKNQSTIVVQIFPGVEGQRHSTKLYEDDGETLGYKKGEYLETELSYEQFSKGRFSLEIAPAVGKFSENGSSKNFVLVFREVSGSTTFKSSLPITRKTYTEDTRTMRIELAAVSNSQGLKLEGVN